MKSDTIDFQKYKTDKQEDLLNNLDFTNNVFVWARCEHCGNY